MSRGSSDIISMMRVRISEAFFFLYLAVQIALPAVQIVRGDNTFRWGMFAGSSERYQIVAEYPGGSSETLDQIRKRTGRARLLRSEIDQKRLVATYLCSGTPRPQTIQFRNLRTGAAEKYTCR